MKILHLHRSVLWIIALLVVAVVAWAISHVNAGHKEWVSAVAFSADGNMLVSAAGNDRTAEVIAWDVKASTVRNRQTLESGRPRWLWCFDSDHAFLGYSVAGKSITDYKPDAVTLLNLADMTVENQFSEPAVAGGTLPLPASKKLVVLDGVRSS